MQQSVFAIIGKPPLSAVQVLLYEGSDWCALFGFRGCFTLVTCKSEISVRIESRIEQAATIWIRIKSRTESGLVVYMFNADCHVGVVYVLQLQQYIQLHVKWSCRHISQLQIAFFSRTVSERSLWYDGIRHVRPIQNFRIDTSLSNLIRIESRSFAGPYFTLYCCLFEPLFMCCQFLFVYSVFKLFWLSRHYLPSDWLGRLSQEARGSSP